jgi:spore maturation protein CgeB
MKKKILLDLKNTAKKSSFLYWVNAKYKGYKLKRNLNKLSHYYNESANVIGFNYDAEDAIERFKHAHRKCSPQFKPKKPGNLRLFWVGTVQSQDESGLLQALHRICHVSVFRNKQGTYGLLSSGAPAEKALAYRDVIDANDEALLEQIKRANINGLVDVLLGQMWAHLLSKEALIQVQNMGIPVINISMDDRLPVHWSQVSGQRLGAVGLASATNIVLTTSSETCLWYGVESCPAVFWPLASDPSVFSSAPDAPRNIDVLFLGNNYGIRGAIIRYLETRGIKVECYGDGWPNGFANAEQMATLSKRARIILGVGTVGYCADVYTLKLRDFDAVMSGALYITHRNPDLCQLFTEGLEIECYEHFDELYKKVCYYLNNVEARIRIATNGQEKAYKRCTWDQRFMSTFQQLGLIEV